VTSTRSSPTIPPIYQCGVAGAVWGKIWPALPPLESLDPAHPVAVLVDDWHALRPWAHAARQAGVHWLPLRRYHGALLVGPLFSATQSGCLECLLTRQNPWEIIRPVWPVNSTVPHPVWCQVESWLRNRAARPRLITLLSEEGIIGEPNTLIPVPACPQCGSPPNPPDTPRDIIEGVPVASTDGGWRVTEPLATLRAIERHVGMICGQVAWVRATPLPFPGEGWLAVAASQQGRVRGYGSSPEQAMVAAIGNSFARTIHTPSPARVSAGVWLEDALLHALTTEAATVASAATSHFHWQPIHPPSSAETDGEWAETPNGLTIARANHLWELHPMREIALQRLRLRLWDATHGAEWESRVDARWQDLAAVGGVRPLPRIREVGDMDEGIARVQAWLREMGWRATWQPIHRADLPLTLLATTLRPYS